MVSYSAHFQREEDGQNLKSTTFDYKLWRMSPTSSRSMILPAGVIVKCCGHPKLLLFVLLSTPLFRLQENLLNHPQKFPHPSFFSDFVTNFQCVLLAFVGVFEFSIVVILKNWIISIVGDYIKLILR